MNHNTLRPRRRMTRVLAVTAAGAMLLAACSGGSDDKDSSTEAAGEPQRGGNLTFALGTDPGCIDPQQSSLVVTLSLGAAFVDTLTDQDPKTGEIVPYLAESWEVSDDATTFTFKLREGVTFSDGTPLDADSVKANFDSIANTLGAKAKLGASYLADYVGTTVTDPNTLEVEFSKPNAPFLQATATASLGILADSTLKASSEDRCQGALVGSGAFTLADYKTGSQVTLKRRAQYDWPSSVSEHTGEAYLDQIDLPIVPDASVRVGQILADQVPGITDVPAQDQDRVEQAGLTLIKRASPGEVQTLFVNLKRPSMQSAAIRQAIQAGIDRQELISTLYNSNYPEATSVLSETTPGHTDLSAELAYDPDEAESLLEGDGWTAGADGIRAKDGEKLALRALVWNGNQPLLELVQAQLKKIGIELELVSVPLEQLTTDHAAGDWDLYASARTRADADALRLDYDSAGWPNSAARLEPSELDDLLAQQAASVDEATRGDAIKQAQELIVSQAYGIPLVSGAQVHAVSDTVHGVTLDASSRLRFYDAWLS